MNVVIIGAGNVATRIACALHETKMSIRQIYSRSEESACRLAQQFSCAWTTSTTHVLPDADFYLFALKDEALQSVIQSISPNNGCWVHTAGSMSIDVFQHYANSYGVLYPLQTLSKTQEVNFSDIPLFIEGNNAESESRICAIAQTLSTQVHALISEKRKYLHLAAVFACNFSNHCYAIATQILEAQGIERQVILPLIDETARKIHTLSPKEAQTGPAVRYDKNVIDKHLSMLADEDLQQLYELISTHIHKTHLL